MGLNIMDNISKARNMDLVNICGTMVLHMKVVGKTIKYKVRYDIIFLYLIGNIFMARWLKI